MTKLVLVIVLLLTIYISKAQSLEVIDEVSRQPVANVLIYQQENNWSVNTDKRGQADISGATDSLLLFFRHPSFRQYAVLKNNAGSRIPLVQNIIHIEQVVVSANRWEQNVNQVPQEIMSISRNDIEQIQPQTSADLLSSTGQVFVQKSQLGGGSPMLRGFAANKVLLIIDGVRMNNAIYRSGNLQNVINIDPLALEGAEVIFGPGSVIYGSDALGGVMNFQTITPRFSPDKRFSGKALLRYSSANHEKTAHLDFTIGRPELSFFSSISYNNFGHLRSGANFKKASDYVKKDFIVERRNNVDEVIKNPDPLLQNPSGYNLFSTINKLRYRIKSYDITYSFYYSSTSDIPRYDRFIETDENGLPTYATWHYGPQQWMMNSLNIEHYNSSLLFDRVRLTIANQQANESRHSRKLHNTFLRNQYEGVDIFSANLDFDKQISKGSLFYGVEALSNSVDSRANRQDINTGKIYASASRYPSGGSTWNSFAFYLSHTYDLGKVQLNSGGRYSYISLNAKNRTPGFLGSEEITINNGAVTGTVGAVYKRNARWKFRGNLSSGFRASNVDDVGKIFELSESTLSVPNENLKPQYTYSAETSTSYNRKSWFMEVTAFRTWIDRVITRNSFKVNGSDSITLEDGSKLKVVALTNSGKAVVNGIATSIFYQFSPAFGLKSHFTYTQGTEKDGTPLRHVPPVFGQLEILLKKRPVNASLYMEYNFTKEAEDIPLTERRIKPHLFALDGSTPGWFTVSLAGASKLPRGFTVRIKAENLLDIHYRPYSSGISAPGRNFSIALNKTF